MYLICDLSVHELDLIQYVCFIDARLKKILAVVDFPLDLFGNLALFFLNLSNSVGHLMLDLVE